MKKTLMFIALGAAFGTQSAQSAELNWNGDVRFRYESKKVDKTTDSVDYAQDRYRTRVRFGFDAWINEELSAGVQLATGDISNPMKETVSRNETYSGIFQPKSIYLNEAYINYHPMSYGLNGKMNVILGKRDISKTLVRVDDLVYDSDLTVEGVTLQYGKDSAGKDQDGLMAIAGYYFLDERFNATSKSNENDPFMMVAQVAYKGEFSDMNYLIGVGDNNFRNLNHFATPDARYSVADRNVVELFGKLGGNITETLPWKVYGQYAFNTSESNHGYIVDSKKRNAWLAGVTIGDAKQPGQWALDFNYNYVEKDSVFPLFTDSDRALNTPNSNAKGYEIGATYHLVQNMTVGAKYYNYRCIDTVAGSPKLQTLQADVVVKF
ncbi:MAG: hypothetical protein HGB15_01980 [Chlorobaculum sp.]|nr:hypothetical protein [Chlorobaculum sp.]